jgi:serine/threonine-protein kinase
VTTRNESDVPSFDLIGELLDGRYRIEKLLGQGGMGAVYLARDERLGKPVVIKVPLAAMALSEQGRQRFLNEIDLLIEVEGEGIVRVLDRGVHRSLSYVVLQYVPGGSLRDRMRERLLEPQEVARWIGRVGAAVDFLHGRTPRVIHRDIKPDNILFDQQGYAFLADFGIARALDRLGLTRPGTAPGSPAYMAPEAMRGQFDPPYDQYALATTVYESLAGRLPFQPGDNGDYLTVKLGCDPERLDAVVPGLSKSIADTVHRALEREPARRYADCRAFAEAFRTSLGSSADRTTVVVGGDDRSRPRWGLYAGLAGVLLAAVAIAWFALQGTSPRMDGPAAAVTPDCVGSSSPDVRWPLRVRLEGFEPAAARALDDSRPWVAVVDAGCASAPVLRAGSDLRAFDDVGRLVSTASNDASGTGRLLQTLYLRNLLSSPEPSGSTELELRVWERPLEEERMVGGELRRVAVGDEPGTTGVFRAGASRAWYYVRMTRWPHLLLVTLTSVGELVVHHPINPALDSVPVDEWFLADGDVGLEGPEGQALTVALASARPWSDVLPRLPPPPADLSRPILEGSPALELVQTLSEHLSTASDWSRASQPLQVDVR